MTSIKHAVTCPNCMKETYEFERYCHICGHDRWSDRDSDPHRTVTRLQKVNDYCPSSWEGRLGDGRHVYIRCRMGAFRVGVGDTHAEATDARNAIVRDDGVEACSTEEMQSHLRDKGWSFDAE